MCSFPPASSVAVGSAAASEHEAQDATLFPAVRGTVAQTHREQGQAPAGGAHTQRAHSPEGARLCHLSSVLKTLRTRTREAAVASLLAQIRTRAFKTLGLPGTILEPQLKMRDGSSRIKGGLLSW